MREVVRFETPAGPLEGRADGPVEGRSVLMLHPHPQAGGTMGSRLVYDVAKGLAEAGFRTFRYNMRGVRDNPGAYDRGNGETDDAVAVFDVLAAQQAPIVIGHSFGGGVAMRLATRRRPPVLVLVGTPPTVSMSDLRPIDDAAQVACPTAVIVGDQDEYVAVPEATRMVALLPQGRLHVLDGAGHFLEPSHNDRVLRLILSVLQNEWKSRE